MSTDFGTIAHKETKQVVYNVRRLGRHYVSNPRNQTPVRYVGTDADGNHVELTPTEFRSYLPAIRVGEAWGDMHFRTTIIAATQQSKCKAEVTYEYARLSGVTRKVSTWTETETVTGLVIS